MAVIDKTLTNPHAIPAGSDRPVIPVWVEIDLAAADVDSAADDLLLVEFPPVAYLRNEAGNVAIRFVSDMDTGTTWQYDLVISDSDAVADVTLDSNSTSGRAANDVALSDAVAGEGLWIDVGGKYLAMNIDGAATGGSTIEVAFEYSQNVKKLAD